MSSSLSWVFIILPHTQTNTQTYANTCMCSAQKKVFSCKINWFWFVIVLTNFVYFSDLHAAVFLHELSSLIFKIFKSFLMCVLWCFIGFISHAINVHMWLKHDFCIIMEYKVYMESEIYIWDIFKIKAFSVRIFKAVLTLLASVIYRGLNCKLLI